MDGQLMSFRGTSAVSAFSNYTIHRTLWYCFYGNITNVWNKCVDFYLKNHTEIIIVRRLAAHFIQTLLQVYKIKH